ncbi:protein NLRC5 [Tachyglossus aculeatus]|uniref:protein NLRC5 n=1 Tax=Tachyglossus aculeatus TaxID=9261 RepID=UPI0018F38DCE|nr:protein NLRC5 [Tachyglossus aculeatus]
MQLPRVQSGVTAGAKCNRYGVPSGASDPGPSPRSQGDSPNGSFLSSDSRTTDMTVQMDAISLPESLWSQLVEILSKDPQWLVEKAQSLLPAMDLQSLRSQAKSLAPTQVVPSLLRLLRTHSLATWRVFIQTLCMELVLPLELETTLLSVWGQGGPGQKREAGNENYVEAPHSLSQLAVHQHKVVSPQRKRIRCQQLELARIYQTDLKTSVLQRYGSEAAIPPGPGRENTSGQVYVDLVIRRNKAAWLRERPERARDEASEAEDGADVGVSGMFEAGAGSRTRVIILLGKPGTGKTTLMRWVCQKWARGELDQFQSVFLFEFRQLNLVGENLTLQQLLFDLFQPPRVQPQAVFQDLQENARRLLLIFDGLDEFLGPWPEGSSQPCEEPAPDPFAPASILDLFSGLCCGTLLPGCCVMVTSRPGRLPDFLLNSVTASFEVWGFDWPRVKEFTSHFFLAPEARCQALKVLEGNRKLQIMCSVPAICRVVCICLGHLPSDQPLIPLPPTVTQLYVQLFHIILGQQPSPKHGRARLGQPQPALLGLCKLALRGLEERRVVFSEENVSEPVRSLALRHHLLVSLEVRTGPWRQETVFAFPHLGLQEFCAALHFLVSPSVDRSSLKRKFPLKSKWSVRTESKMGLLDHFHIFLSGLSAPACRGFLAQLARREEAWVQDKQLVVLESLLKLATTSLTGPKVMELCHCVGETQDPELAERVGRHLHHKYGFHNFRLTHSDLEALALLVDCGTTPIDLDFAGCPVEPDCLEALAKCRNVGSLSFRSRKCGDAFAEALARSLPGMTSLKKVGLIGSKITSQGVDHLMQAFTNCLQLEEINLQDNKLRDLEVLKITEIFSGVKKLQKIDLSHNEISVKAILALAKTAVTSPKVRELQIRQEEIVILFSVPPGMNAEAPGSLDLKRHENKNETAPQTKKLTLRLQQCNLGVQHAEVIAGLLREGSCLEEVDLSGNHLEDGGCRELMKVLPYVTITRRFNISDNGLTTEGVCCLLNTVNACSNVVEVEACLQLKTTILKFAGNHEAELTLPRAAVPLSQSSTLTPDPLSRISRTIRLTGWDFSPRNLQQLEQVLSKDNHFTDLDLSNNSLGDKGIQMLVLLLPSLSALKTLNLSGNNASLETAFCLAQAFSTLEHIAGMDIGLGSQQSILVTLHGRTRDTQDAGSPERTATHLQSSLGEQGLSRSFCLRECVMEPVSMQTLCQALEKCSGPMDVRFSCNALSDQSIEVLLHYLPRLQSLQRLQIDETSLSPNCPFLLAKSLSLCRRIRKLEVRSRTWALMSFATGGKGAEKSCRLTDCGLDQEHVERLFQTLQLCKHLSQLDLSGNQLGNEGIRCLLEHLPQMDIAGSLNLSHNHLSQEGILHLVRSLSTCSQASQVHLSLEPEENVLIQFTKETSPWKTLRLSKCDLQLEHLSELAALVGQSPFQMELLLTDSNVSLLGLKHLLKTVRKTSGMLRISVEEQWVLREDIVTLLEMSIQAAGNLTEITILKFQALLRVGEEFPQPPENPEPEAARMAQCGPETGQTPLIRQIIEKCTRLRELNWSHVVLNDDVSRILGSVLPSLPALKTFRLTSSPIFPRGIERLAAGLSCCHGLQELDLSNLKLDDPAIQILAQGLHQMSLLQRLTLSNCGISGDGCSQLSDAFKKTSNLEDLNLSLNKIDSTGMQHLAAVLPEMPQLRRLDLSENCLGPSGGMELARALALCRTMEEFRLGKNAMEDLTAVELSKILPSYLKILNLQSNNIGPEGLASLALTLARCRQVEEISLAENRFGDGIPLLFSKLCGLPKLRKIDLKCCGIRDQESKPLARSFGSCPAMEEILLSWNCLGDEGATELAQVLPQLTKLRRLDLESNQITAQGARQLVEGLAQGPSIQVIRLWKNRIPKDVARQLQEQDSRLDFSSFPQQ